MGKPGRDRAPSSVNPGDSATRQEVRLGGPPTRTRWGGYHLARPGGPPGPKGVWYPQNQTSNLKPLYVSHFTPRRGSRRPGFADVGPKVLMRYYYHSYGAQILCWRLSLGKTAKALPTRGESVILPTVP